MDLFCSNYIIFWCLLMNSIQRRSNPFQLCQCTPRQNLQARMKIVDKTISPTLWWDQLLSILLRSHTLATKVKSLSQYHCIIQNRCNVFNKTLLFLQNKLQYSEIYSRRPWKREEKILQFFLALSEYIWLKSSPIFSFPWGVKLAPSVFDNMKSWDLYDEWTQMDWTRKNNSLTFWPQLIQRWDLSLPAAV